MALHFNCPNCDHETTLPDEAIERRARCLSCQSTYAVKEAVGGALSNEYIPHSHKFILGYGIGIPVLLLLVFLLFWFGMRDTWESDNYSEIIHRCDALLLAIEHEDNNAATVAKWELDRLISDRYLEQESLLNRVIEARRAFVMTKKRREQAIREQAKEQAEKIVGQLEQVGQQKQDVGGGFRGFTEAELERIHKKLLREGYNTDEALFTMMSMLDYPDTRAAMRRWLDGH